MITDPHLWVHSGEALEECSRRFWRKSLKYPNTPTGLIQMILPVLSSEMLLHILLSFGHSGSAIDFRKPHMGFYHCGDASHVFQ